MQIKTILFMMISIIPFTCLAQKSKQVKAIKKVEPIETEDENHPPMGSPIVNLLKAIDYAEVCDDCILTPNCATECEEDGTVSTDETALDVIKYIINRDVIGYFELGEEVNSPLKLKKYKESQDYKNNLTFLNGVRSCVMNHEYFIESDFDSKFELDSQTFKFEIPAIYECEITTTDTHLSNDGYFTTPILDENLAHEIETNKVKTFLFVKIAEDCGEYIQFIPQRLYLATVKTGKILYEYEFKEEPTKKEEIAVSTAATPSEVVETMPQYPGGEMAIFKHIFENIKYPVDAMEKGIQGRVVVNFIIEKDGSIGNASVESSLYPSLDAEAIRVIKTLKKFTPGTQNGKPVAVGYHLPITFRMQ